MSFMACPDCTGPSRTDWNTVLPPTTGCGTVLEAVTKMQRILLTTVPDLSSKRSFKQRAATPEYARLFELKEEMALELGELR